MSLSDKIRRIEEIERYLINIYGFRKTQNNTTCVFENASVKAIFTFNSINYNITALISPCIISEAVYELLDELAPLYNKAYNENNIINDIKPEIDRLESRLSELGYTALYFKDPEKAIVYANGDIEIGLGYFKNVTESGIVGFSIQRAKGRLFAAPSVEVLEIVARLTELYDKMNFFNEVYNLEDDEDDC